MAGDRHLAEQREPHRPLGGAHRAPRDAGMTSPSASGSSRYGLPSETSTVGRAESVAVISRTSESGIVMVPRDVIGRTWATKTTRSSRAMVARAESYDCGPDMGQSRK